MAGGGAPSIQKPTNQQAHAAGKAEYTAGLPTVTAPALSPENVQQQAQRAQFQQQHPLGSDISAKPGFVGKFEHALSRIGNTAADIIAPGLAINVPGSDMYNRAQNSRFERQFTGALDNEGKQAQTQLTQAEIPKTEADTFRTMNPISVGKTPDEQAFASLLTQTNPDTNKQYSPLEAFTKLNQSKQDVKPDDPMKAPVGEGAKQFAAQLETLTGGMNPQEKAAFTSAFAINPGDSQGVAQKRLEDAKAAAAMSGSERDRAIARSTAQLNHQDAQAERTSQQGLQSVQYQDKDGKLVSGSLADAQAAGGSGIRKISPEDQQKARTAHTQYQRWIDNAQSASDTMGAWDNPSDKNLAIRLQHNFFDHAIIPGVGIDPDYVNTFLNSDDYKSLSPLGQQHMQNMATVWSDAINLMKAETGGVPRGEHFLKLESAILPQPDKTQAMNRQALKQFEQRIKTDSTEYARPNDMAPLTGVVPEDAQTKLMKAGHVVGYRGSDGKVVMF